MTLQLEHRRDYERPYVFQYAVLTIALFLPLLWAFIKVRNTYPIAVWNMMMAGGELQRSRTYFILRGETLDGEKVEISAAGLTNGLYGRTWGMVGATANNDSFRLQSLHPANERLLSQVGQFNNLPQGARMTDLLGAWGEIYNERLPQNSTKRLRAISLDMYRWDSGKYADFDRFIDSWRKEL